MVYAFTEMDSFVEVDLAGLWTLLSEQRKKQVDRYLFFKNRKQSALAYILLRYALVREWEIQDKVEFDYGPYGKPFIKGKPEIYFNLSHSANGIVCGTAEVPIGVDIADIDEKSLDCIHSAMHPNEQKVIESSKNPAQMFARFWSLKECYLKYLGIGISEKLSDIDFSGFDKDSFTYESICMQVRSTGNAIISTGCLNPQPIRFVKKTDLFELLLGEKNYGNLAYA